MSDTVALALEGISVRIGAATLVDDVTTTVPGGQVTAIVGPNGAGKSTLLAVAAGTRTPSAGRVRLDGSDIAHLPVRSLARRRAVMTQHTTVVFPFTVAEVVAMGRAAHGGAADAHLCAQVLAATELEDLADRDVTTLSGGERQRVAFARTLAQAAGVEDMVLLLDEPTAAMDIAHAESALQLLRRRARAGAAVAVVLHDLDAAAAYADRLVLLDAGRVRAAGPVSDVARADLLSRVYRTPIEVSGAGGGRIRIGPARPGTNVMDG